MANLKNRKQETITRNFSMALVQAVKGAADLDETKGKDKQEQEKHQGKREFRKWMFVFEDHRAKKLSGCEQGMKGRLNNYEAKRREISDRNQ